MRSGTHLALACFLPLCKVQCLQHNVLLQLCAAMKCNLQDDKSWLAYLHFSISQEIQQCIIEENVIKSLKHSEKCIFEEPPNKRFIKSMNNHNQLKIDFKHQCPINTRSKNSIFGILTMSCQEYNMKILQKIENKFSIPVIKSVQLITLDPRLKLNLTILSLHVGNHKIFFSQVLHCANQYLQAGCWTLPADKWFLWENKPLWFQKLFYLNFIHKCFESNSIQLSNFSSKQTTTCFGSFFR